MNFKVVLLLTVSLFTNIHCLKVNSDGGYSDIVIRIEDELQHQECSAVLENLQNFVRLASEALSSALSGWLVENDWCENILRFDTKIFGVQENILWLNILG